jgi:hypothetical protein
MERHATLSPCGAYRYRLTRLWAPDQPPLTFVMLNPSTADHQQDDPTIRKCCGFARRLGYGGIRVFNLFALRSTMPAGLLFHADPVGPRNDEFLSSTTVGITILAWGAPSNARVRQLVEARQHAVLAMLRERPLFCLGRTNDGAPRHPLMLAYESPLQPYVSPLQSAHQPKETTP